MLRSHLEPAFKVLRPFLQHSKRHSFAGRTSSNPDKQYQLHPTPVLYIAMSTCRNQLQRPRSNSTLSASQPTLCSSTSPQFPRIYLAHMGLYCLPLGHRSEPHSMVSQEHRPEDSKAAAGYLLELNPKYLVGFESLAVKLPHPLTSSIAFPRLMFLLRRVLTRRIGPVNRGVGRPELFVGQ